MEKLSEVSGWRGNDVFHVNQIPSVTHPVSLVLLQTARTVRLHAVLLLQHVSHLTHVSCVVNERQRLVLYRLTH